MKKLLSFVSVALVMAMLLLSTACNQDTAEQEKLNVSVAALKGPTGVGMVNLMADQESGKGSNNYTFTVAASADEITGKFINSEINIASVPTNLAAKLSTKTNGDIVMLAVNTLGVLSILEKGNSITSVADLKGKTIYATGEGSNPEYILRYVLEQNDINPDTDVNIVFVGTGDELSAKVISGEAEVAMVPEPAATIALTKNKDYSRVLDMTEEWNKVGNGSQLMMGCVVALKSYVENNREAVEKFLDDYSKSIAAVSENADNTASLCEQYEIIPSAAVAKNALPGCNVTFVTGKEMKEQITGYFEVLYKANPSSIGSIPESGFYYGAE